MCNLKTNHLEDALDDAKRAAELRSEGYRPHVRAGQALLRMERYAEAVTAFEQAIALHGATGSASPSKDVARLLQKAKEKLAKFGDSPHDDRMKQSEAAFIADVQAGNIDGVQAYIDRGYSLEARASSLDASGATAVILATQGLAPRIVESLLRAGADVNASDIHGRTALWYAAQMDSPVLAALLLRAGARKDLADNAGVSPANLAQNVFDDTSFSEVLVLFDEDDPGAIPVPDLDAPCLPGVTQQSASASAPRPPTPWADQMWFVAGGVTVLGALGLLTYTFLRRK